jgi:hypothetical protein
MLMMKREGRFKNDVIKVYFSSKYLVCLIARARELDGHCSIEGGHVNLWDYSAVMDVNES